MTRFVFDASVLLLRFELVMTVSGVRSVWRIVKSHEPRYGSPSSRPTTATLCRAIDIACAFYPKRVLCLQRSAATVLLLRRHGIAAELVIGAQILPFRSHAWVEVDKCPVGDKSYVSTLYQELERC
jgi:hypothetical protein